MSTDAADREPRLPRLGPDDVAPKARAVFEAFLRERGNIPNLFRIAAHSPGVLDAFRGAFAGVMGEGAATVRLKELVAVRVSHVNACEYCLASHTTLARRFGATEAELAALAAGDFAPFTAGEAAAFRAADAITRGTGHVDAAVIDDLRTHWQDAQVVELLAVIALFNLFNRFANALDIPPTR